MDRANEYEVVGKFDCYGISMVVIKAVHGTHIMPGDEWDLTKQILIKESDDSHLKIEKYKVA